MAGHAGRIPQETHARKRNDPERTKLVAGSKPVGRPLPRGMLGIDKDTGEMVAWHPMTVRWWNHWRRSPQASRMLSEADWDFLLDTALIHHEMWRNHRWEFASEIRLRVAKFGATPEDRLRLRAEIVTAEEEPVGNVSVEQSSVRERRLRLVV